MEKILNMEGLKRIMSLKDVKIKKPFPMKVVQVMVVLLLLSANILLVKIFNILN